MGCNRKFRNFSRGLGKKPNLVTPLELTTSLKEKQRERGTCSQLYGEVVSKIPNEGHIRNRRPSFFTNK